MPACAGMTRIKVKEFGLLVLVLGVLGAWAPAHAFTAPELEAYCQDGNHNFRIAKGLQPDQRPANAAVLDLLPGRYELPDGSKLEVNPEVELQIADSRGAKPTFTTQKYPTYTLWILPHKNPLIGTHAADKIHGQEFGGCSLEQLSELLKKNNMPIEFKEDKDADEKKKK
jgi:hypothetical protein